MEVILCKDVEKVGKVGEIIKVKDGFARNFLLPKRLAYLATPMNIRRIEQQKVKIAKEYADSKKGAEELAEKLSKISCTVTVEVNDLEKLYGSVSEAEISKALELEGFSIDKKNIIMEKPLEELGIFEVGIKLHPEVTTKIRVWVAKR